MLRSIQLWQSVAEDAALLHRASAVDASDVAAVTSLRRDYPAEHVSVALSLTESQAKAVTKFGDRGRSMVADVAGIEQASSEIVAAYKANRIVQLLGKDTTLADLCCGIGGDSMALSEAGLNVIAVDHDPLRAWMAKHNGGARIHAVCADVDSLALQGLPIHLDPARRNEGSGKRAWRLEDYQPGPEVIGRLIDQSSASALKLSPGVEVDALPWPGEVEFISDHGRLVQAVLWGGKLKTAERRATLLDAQGTHSLSGLPSIPTYHAAQRYVYTFDAAIERAELIGPLSNTLQMPVVHPKLGLLTSDHVITSPWVTGFELLEVLPWRPKRVRQWLAAHDGGLVEVKTRGKACNPDSEQQRLRGKGGTPYVVFVLRFDTKVQALIARRLGSQ